MIYLNEWNEGYFTADTYTYGYYKDLSPTYQNFCLLLRGFAAPEINENSNFCELGFGQGVSVNIHAASTPGHFYGTDFNPAHAANANELCEASGCDGKFFDDSFEEMLNRDDLPQFDFISLHGIWTWVSAENQKIIVEFARKFLKSGGVLYNSYNTFPGWAAHSPMRELLIMYDKFIGSNNSDINSRVGGAVKFTEDLLNAKPLYARGIANVDNVLNDMKKDDPHYVAHEFLNRDWICMYFADVVEMLSSAKLEFACTTSPLDSIDELNLKPEAISFLNKINNPILREQSRDYFVNTRFRKDLFIRGARRISAFERRKRLLNMSFVLLTTESFEIKCNTVLGELAFNSAYNDTLMEFLASDNYRPKKFADIMKKNPSIPFETIEQFIILLVSIDKLMPCQDEAAIKKVKAQCDKLNDYLFKRVENSNEINLAVSPVIGGGIGLSRFAQIFAYEYKHGKKDVDSLARKAWKIIESQGQRLIIEGKTAESAEDNIEEFKRMARFFLEKQLPILRIFQIV